MHPIIQLLKKSKSVFLATHVHPDGDAIGSLLALGLGLKKSGKTVTMYIENKIPIMYRFLPEVDQIVHKIESFDLFDTAVILDCGALERIGREADNALRVPVLINIDHHATNAFFSEYSLVDPTASATTQIVYDILTLLAVTIDKDIAYSIYTGILTDTGSFQFSNANHRAFSISAEMVQIGVEPNVVAKHVYITYSLGRIKLLRMVLDSIEVSPNGKLSLMTLTQKMLRESKTRPENVGRLINYAEHIEDVKVAILIHEHHNGRRSSRRDDQEHPFHVSLRSDGSIDVAAIAATFGGGGHQNAAGFNIRTTLPDLRKKMLSLSETL